MPGPEIDSILGVDPSWQNISVLIIDGIREKHP
jgi:hypothetical protein